jgi:hypothetical protein
LVAIVLTDNDIFHPYRHVVPTNVHWVDSADDELPARHPDSLRCDIKAIKREVAKVVRGQLSLLKEYLNTWMLHDSESRGIIHNVAGSAPATISNPILDNIA